MMVDINKIKYKRPAWLWERFELGGSTKPYHNILFRLDYGFNFILERITYKNQENRAPNGAPDLHNVLRMELIHGIKNRPLQNEAIILRQVSTPGEQGIFYALAPSPVDQDAFGNVSNANELKDQIKFNEPYLFNEGIYAKFSFLIPANYLALCDVVFMGYYVPENSLEMWC